MKHVVKKLVLLVALTMMTMLTTYAKETSKVEVKVKQLTTKYEEVKGVECMTVTNGFGLGLVKLMFNKQFGKEFMKGVTAITVIDYSDASQQTCQALRKELNAFTILLEEVKLGEEKELADFDLVRCFVMPSDDKTISDFIIAVENKDSKMIMYMAGKIKVK